MPPEEEAAPEETQKKQRSGSLKTLLILVLIFAVFGVFGALVGTGILFPPLRPAGTGELGIDDEDVETPEKERPSGAPIFYDPIELIVNIEDKGIDRFLIVEISLQIETESLKKELASIDPQIRDRFNSVLRSKTYDDLKGARGQDMLRRELVESVNTLLETGRVVDAFLSKIQIQ